jgi:cytochrome P450
MYDIHHHPRIWENPNVFNPDRFAPEGEASHNPEEGGHKWLSFSHGYRQCIGMSFSLAEQQVFLSMFWKLPTSVPFRL